MAVDLEQMNVTMNARFDQFSRQLAKLDADYQKTARSLLAKNDNLRKRLSAPLAPLKGLGTTLGIGLSVAAVGEFVKSVSESVDQIKRQSAALGATTDQYQELVGVAQQAEVSQDELNTTLDKFAANLGDAQLHVTPFSQLMKEMKVDIRAGTIPAFLQFIDVVNRLSVAQRDAVMKMATGRGFASLAGFMQQGSAAIKQQMEDWKKSGGVIDKFQIEKIDELGDAWRKLKTQMTVAGAGALSGFSDSLDEIIKGMGQNDFQAALKNFGSVMGQVAGFVVKMGPYLPALVAAMGGSRFGPIGAAAAGGAVLGIFNPQEVRTPAQQKVFENLMRDPENAQQFGAQVFDYYHQAQAELKKLATPDDEKPKVDKALDLSGILDADKMAKLAQERKEMLDRIGVDQSEANANLVAEQDKLTVQLLTGQVGYYDAVQKMIVDDMNAKLAVIDAEEKKQIDSLGKQGTAWKGYADAVAKVNATADAKRGSLQAQVNTQADESGSGLLLRQSGIQSKQQIQSYKDQASNLGLIEAALAAATFEQEQYNAAREKGLVDAQGNLTLKPEEIALIKQEAAAVGAAAQAESDAAKISERSIQMQDELRTGLEDVGVAGLRGFKDMKDAASQFIEQLAEMILKLYVMKPLIESLLGPQGGSGGELLGDFLGSIFGSSSSPAGGVMGFFPFAKGGVMTPNGPRMLPRYAAGGVSNSAAIFGEAGPEAAVPLPDGRRIPVALRLPSLRQMGRGGNFVSNPVVNIDARGAQIGVAEQIAKAAPLIAEATLKATRSEFAQNMAKHMRDTF